MVCNGQFLVCVVKRQPLLVSNFTGKMVSWNTEFYVDFEASPMIMKDYSSDRAFFEQAFENLLHDFEDFLENQEIIEG